MATYTAPKKPNPITLDKFLGVNESIGDTEIKFGESVYQRNFYITKNYKARKRSGYSEVIDTLSGVDIDVMWQGSIGGKDVLIYSSDAEVYEYNFGTELASNIGTLDQNATSVLFYDSTLYFLDGSAYYSYDGTTFQVAVPYIPVVEIGGEYDGSGAVSFEGVNLLTPSVYVSRLGDGTHTVFTMSFDFDSCDSVTVDGVSATFTNTPPSRDITITSGTPADNAEVTFELDTGIDQSDLIEKHTKMVVFGVNQSSVFMFGRDNNTVNYSYVGNPLYFPESNYSYAGTNEQPITDLKPIYDRLVAFKPDSAHYTYAESNPLYNSTDGQGLDPYVFLFYHLNERYGSVSDVQVVNQRPYALDGGGIYAWSYQSVVNNIDPTHISDRIRISLESLDLSTAVTFNYKRLKEYWVNIGDVVYIYNYGTDVFYMYDNIEATCFVETEDTLYFGTKNGTIMVMDGSLNDNGTAITARIEMPFTAYGAEQWLKNLFYGYPTIASDTRTSLTITYATEEDNEECTEDFEVKFVLFDYGDIDYGDFSYATNRNPQSQPQQLKIKKFQYIKWIFENSEDDETLTILSWKTQPTPIKEVK